MSVWLEKLKLSKQLAKSVTEAGFLAPREFQSRTMSRIIGGQDLIGIAPQGSGKTTTLVLATLAKLKHGLEEAPRALILVPDKEKVEQVIEQFELLNRNKTIRIRGAYPGPSLETQMDEILEGTDIVVATPDRARAIYLKLGLNLNKIVLFIVDDAELIVKQGLQLPVAELANSIRNCQHLVFSEVLHEKLRKMIDPFMKQPAVIEVEELLERKAETIPQILYKVPDFKTKINLLQLLTGDAELLGRALVFVNTRLTAEKIYQSLSPSLKKATAVLQPLSYDTPGVQSADDFLQHDKLRILLVANESKPDPDPHSVPFIIHFELPAEKETYISRMIKAHTELETLAITFSTDLELSDVKKIEQAIGSKLEVSPLPDDLVIFKEKEPKEKSKVKPQEEEQGQAFHEKKASNVKDYNYGAGQKARMNKKKKH